MATPKQLKQRIEELEAENEELQERLDSIGEIIAGGNGSQFSPA